MRFKELTEGKNTPSVVVDVQPAYTGGSYGADPEMVQELMQFLNGQHGPILAFVNAEDQGLTEDTLDEVKWMWEEYGFENWDNVTWYDKGFGYLREAMDMGIDDGITIKVIREMYQQRVSDSRDLFDGEYEEMLQFIESIGGTDEDLDIFLNGIGVEWVSIKLLKEHAGYIMGGAREQCLREVELLMSAFNIRHKRIEQFIYD